jgi:hypothetical protein
MISQIKKYLKGLYMLKKIFLFALLLPVLVSCYTQKIYLNADKKSGKMIIDYTIDDDYFQLLSIALDNFASEEDPIDPASFIDQTLFKETFDSKFGSSKDVKLKSLSIKKGNNYTANIVIEFYDLDKLLAKIPKGITNLNITKVNTDLTISQILDIKKMDPDGAFKEFVMQQKEDDINFYNRLTKEAKFYFVMYSAVPIKKIEGISLSEDRKTAEYSFKLNDFINSDNKILKFLITL